MKRRRFLSITSAGLPAMLVAPEVWASEFPMQREKEVNFVPYRPNQTVVPVHQIDIDSGFYIHTFYDVCPWSPSGRYLVLTRLPYQEKKPRWGDTAEIWLIDLEQRTCRKVYETRAWAFQLGSHAQWNAYSDRFLYTNDIIDEQTVCVRVDLHTGQTVAYSGPKYDLSPDGKFAAGPRFDYINATQYGYSTPDPPDGRPVLLRKDQMDSEGLWVTHLETNHSKLVASMNDFYRHAVPEDRQRYKNGIYYLFHTKYNSPGNRIMQVFRCLLEDGERNASLYSLKPDGKDIIQCFPFDKWNQRDWFGGRSNHPNWHPDGEHIIMNTVPTWLGLDKPTFSMFRYDGSDFRVLSEKHLASGHPSVDPDTRFLLTDAYQKQKYITRNNEIPIRLIHLETDTEHILCTIANNVGNDGKKYSDKEGGSHFKLDPHPVWSRDYTQICFNGAPSGERQVFIADLKKLM